MKQIPSAAFICKGSTLAVLVATTLSPAMPSSITQAHAQTPSTLYVWDGSVASAARVAPWGNGTAQQAGRGSNALQVTTHSFYEGVRFDLNTPIDIEPYKQTGFWRIKVQMRGASPFGGGGRRTAALPDAAALDGETSTRSQARMSPQVETNVQFQQRPQRGGGGARQGGRGQQAPTLTQLQLTAVLDQGTMSGRVAVNAPTRGNAAGGQTLLIALRDMRPTPGASGAVRRLILTGDRSATFGLEQIALVTETDRITASIRRASDPQGTQLQEITVKPGRDTTLVADVEGGTSDLLVQWNFDADNTGAFPLSATAGGRGAGPVAGGLPGAAMANVPRVDAIGLSVQPNWPNEEQNYRVEITVTDRARRKAPVKASLLVKARG
ncbi:MAG TPA: hypothetical protein VF600_03335 [Abditibacteriaceae bacterium]|jgi:hypothetical protein